MTAARIRDKITILFFFMRTSDARTPLVNGVRLNMGQYNTFAKIFQPKCFGLCENGEKISAIISEIQTR